MFVFPRLVFCDQLKGIFSEACAALAIISEDNADRYRQEAVEKGFKGQEIEEHVQRRIRNRYLAEKGLDALDELRVAQMFAHSPIEAVASNPETSKTAQESLKKTMQEIGQRAGSTWTSGEKTARERAPLVFSILENSAPHNVVQFRRFETLVAMKALMAIERQAISQYLLKVPHDSTISEKSRSDLLTAQIKGSMKTADRVLRIGNPDMIRVYAQNIEAALAGQSDAAKRERVADVERLVTKLLRSDKVPQEVKDEIGREQDFMSKVKITSRSPAFSEFIIIASEYFSVY